MTGSANDAQDDPLSGAIVWTSSIDGSLGTGASVARVLTVGTHTITARATDSGGLSGQAQISVTITGTSTTTPLTNGVPVTGISDSTSGNFKYYSLVVPAGQSTLTFTISGGTGDVDMYVNLGSAPTTTVYQCRPYLSGNNETCTFTPPQAGTYYVGLRGYSAYSGVTLTGTYGASSGCATGDPTLTNGVGQSISGASGSSTYRCIKSVPAGKTLTLGISGGTGDPAASPAERSKTACFGLRAVPEAAASGASTVRDPRRSDGARFGLCVVSRGVRTACGRRRAGRPAAACCLVAKTAGRS
jgi:hypothetical protein